MKKIEIEQGSDEWVDFRKGKISGTILGDVYSKRGGRKIGFYQLIADRLGLDPDDENRMDRGLRLEDEAIAIFEEKTGLKVEQDGVCVSDFSDQIINSPDGLIKSDGKYIGAVEVKCISPARHIQAIVEKKIPSEFETQVVQYFIVNDDLKTLYFIFYDPRVPAIPYLCLEVKREEIKDKIEFFKTWQIETLAEINKIIEELAF
jgi:hypothetical protein